MIINKKLSTDFGENKGQSLRWSITQASQEKEHFCFQARITSSTGLCIFGCHEQSLSLRCQCSISQFPTLQASPWLLKGKCQTDPSVSGSTAQNSVQSPAGLVSLTTTTSVLQAMLSFFAFPLFLWVSLWTFSLRVRWHIFFPENMKSHNCPSLTVILKVPGIFCFKICHLDQGTCV